MQNSARALLGVAAALAGVGAGHAVAALVDPGSGPAVAVGAVVIDLTPTPVKEWAVAAFGTADKAVLLGGVLVVVAALGAVAGVLLGRSRAIALGLVAALGVVCVAAAITRPDAGGAAALPGAIAALTGGAALVSVSRWVDRAGGSAVEADADPRRGAAGSRRRLLVGTAGLVAGGGVLAWVGERLGGPTVEEVPLVLPEPSEPLGELPAGLATVAPGISPLRTPTEDFYRIDIALAPPRVAAADWRLDVRGLVEAPFSLSWDELVAMPMIERDITLTCVSNPIGGEYVGATRWLGVPVVELLRRAGPRPEADMVLSSAPDGFSASTPLAVLLDGRDAMIAVAMDGAPLTREHGAPARLLTPGLYGYVGATKWLASLEVTTFAAAQAYWTRRGWADRAPVKTATRIDVPRGGVRAGEVAVGGVAWATHRGVSRVEVQIDTGPWVEAELSDDVGVDYWRQWVYRWPATPGQHRISARTWDGEGVVQPEQVAGVLPDGPTGYHVVVVDVA